MLLFVCPFFASSSSGAAVGRAYSRVSVFIFVLPSVFGSELSWIESCVHSTHRHTDEWSNKQCRTLPMGLVLSYEHCLVAKITIAMAFFFYGPHHIAHCPVDVCASFFGSWNNFFFFELFYLAWSYCCWLEKLSQFNRKQCGRNNNVQLKMGQWCRQWTTFLFPLNSKIVQKLFEVGKVFWAAVASPLFWKVVVFPKSFPCVYEHIGFRLDFGLPPPHPHILNRNIVDATGIGSTKQSKQWTSE